MLETREGASSALLITGNTGGTAGEERRPGASRGSKRQGGHLLKVTQSGQQLSKGRPTAGRLGPVPGALPTKPPPLTPAGQGRTQANAFRRLNAEDAARTYKAHA